MASLALEATKQIKVVYTVDLMVNP